MATDAAEHETLSIIIFWFGGFPPLVLRQAIDNGQARAPSTFCADPQ
jgi:hypothetical protein